VALPTTLPSFPWLTVSARLPSPPPPPLPPGQDLRHMPALQDLVKGLMRTALSGDASQWDAALQVGQPAAGGGCARLSGPGSKRGMLAACATLAAHCTRRSCAGRLPTPPPASTPQMPHYSTYSMPALSLHCGAHVSP
jgi:hypothetical protein